MIPKIIHYCWFGNAEKPQKVKDCIESWKKVLSDYEIIEWNESNFNIEMYNFAKEAYKKKKYAFVSDVARFHVLDLYGGYYLDTDVEVINSFDNFCNEDYIVALESFSGNVATSTIGSRKGHKINKNMLDIYKKKSFIKSNGKYEETPNTIFFKRVLAEYINDDIPNKDSLIKDVHFYSHDVFHPLDLISGKLKITKNTVAIHWHTLLWISRKTKVIKFMRQKLIVPLIGEANYKKITNKLKGSTDD